MAIIGDQYENTWNFKTHCVLNSQIHSKKFKSSTQNILEVFWQVPYHP